MKQRISAIIIARPGQFRDGLQTLLQTIPQIDDVRPVGDCVAALSLDRAYHPGILLIDLSLPDSELPMPIQQLKARWSGVPWVVLVDHEHELEAAHKLGVDAVMVKGVLATRLLAAIESLLAEQA